MAKFEISLRNRAGISYVYSSRHVSHDDALDEFLNNQKEQAELQSNQDNIVDNLCSLSKTMV